MITIRNVSYRIGTHPILDNVSLDIPEGGITALIGPNGAGKSTLFSFMARLRPLESGSIAYRGKNLAGTPTAELARTLSILTQENSIMSRITVRDLLMFGRYPTIKADRLPNAAVSLTVQSKNSTCRTSPTAT